MSVIADIALPAEHAPLGPLVTTRPGVRVRLETLVPTGERVMPYIWIRDPSVESVEKVFEDSPAIRSAEVVDHIADEALFRVTWSDDVEGFVASIDETDGTVLQGIGQDGRWEFQLRFPDYDQLSAFYRDSQRRGIAVDLERVYKPTDPVDKATQPFTDAQREALQIALEEGYFAVPREITLEGLADRLGISDSAVSQRIRRGLTQLLTLTLRHE